MKRTLAAVIFVNPEIRTLSSGPRVSGLIREVPQINLQQRLYTQCDAPDGQLEQVDFATR